MNGLKILIAFLCSTSLLASRAVQALEIQQFDKLAGKDQDEYIADLIQGAEQVLTNEGHADLSAQVSGLFRTTLPGDQVSLGMTEFYRNLAIGREADVKRATQDPHARRIQVEDAMALTLKKNGIVLPGAFFTVNSSFQPKFPPK